MVCSDWRQRLEPRPKWELGGCTRQRSRERCQHGVGAERVGRTPTRWTNRVERQQLARQEDKLGRQNGGCNGGSNTSSATGSSATSGGTTGDTRGNTTTTGDDGVATNKGRSTNNGGTSCGSSNGNTRTTMGTGRGRLAPQHRRTPWKGAGTRRPREEPRTQRRRKGEINRTEEIQVKGTGCARSDKGTTGGRGVRTIRRGAGPPRSAAHSTHRNWGGVVEHPRGDREAEHYPGRKRRSDEAVTGSPISNFRGNRDCQSGDRKHRDKYGGRKNQWEHQILRATTKRKQ